MYVQESLQCFLRNIPNASSVMLGVASERVFDLLFESFQNYIQDQRVIEKFELAKKRASLKQRYDLVEKELERHKVNLSPNVKENLDINLAGIFTLIRLQRNDSGHPTGLSIDRDQMFVHLRMFVMYCKTIYDVIDSLQKADHSFH